MEYVVEISFISFSFENLDDAVGFAEEAAQHVVDDTKIELVFVREKKEEEE